MAVLPVEPCKSTVWKHPPAVPPCHFFSASAWQLRLVPVPSQFIFTTPFLVISRQWMSWFTSVTKPTKYSTPKPQNTCASTQFCANGGTCFYDGTKSFCTCKMGFTGPRWVWHLYSRREQRFARGIPWSEDTCVGFNVATVFVITLTPSFSILDLVPYMWRSQHGHGVCSNTFPLSRRCGTVLCGGFNVAMGGVW